MKQKMNYSVLIAGLVALGLAGCQKQEEAPAPVVIQPEAPAPQAPIEPMPESVPPAEPAAPGDMTTPPPEEPVPDTPPSQ